MGVRDSVSLIHCFVCVQRFMALQVIKEQGGSVSYELISPLIVVRNLLSYLTNDIYNESPPSYTNDTNL